MSIGAPLTAVADGTTLVNITIPAGAQPGQGMVLVIATQPDGTIPTPDGWLPVKGPVAAGSGVIAAVFTAYVQESGALAPGAVVAVNVGGTVPPRTTALLAVYPGVDQVGMIHLAADPLVLTTSGAARATPGITTTLADCWVVEIVTSKQTGATNYTAPSGYTKRAQVFRSDSSPGIALGDTNTAKAAGTYGGDVWTCNVSGGSAVTFTLALAPKLATQTARPISDVTPWTSAVPEVAVGQAQAARIGEAVRDDATYVETGANPAGEVGEWRFQTLLDPGVHTGHTLDYVIWTVGSATSSSAVMSLMEGATTIATWTETDVPDVPTLYSHTLSEAEAAAITDYGNLRLSADVTVA